MKLKSAEYGYEVTEGTAYFGFTGPLNRIWVDEVKKGESWNEGLGEDLRCVDENYDDAWLKLEYRIKFGGDAKEDLEKYLE